MAENTILKAMFEAKNGDALDNLINLIREKGFVVRETEDQPKGPCTRYETTMDMEELSITISEAGVPSTTIIDRQPLQ